MSLILLALKATALLALGSTCAMAARRGTASLRHAIWMSALAGALVLPAGSLWIPRWEVFPAPPAVAGSLVTAAPAGITLTVVAESPHISWVELALGVWALGAAIVFLRWLWGAWQATRLVRRCRPAAWANGCLQRCAEELQFSGTVCVVESAETPMPFNWGSTVVLPGSLRQAPESRLRAILLHELAHVERGDSLSQWVAHAAASVYWFHPLAWLALARTRREREHACDDRVVELSARPSAYAADLLEVARTAARGQQPATALAMAEASELEERVMAILDSGKKRGRLSRLGIIVIVAALLAVVLPLAATQAIGSGAGAVSGVVRDASQTPVKGARVILTAPGGGGSAAVVTDTAGGWRVAQLAAGTYSIEVQARGFQLLRRTVEVKEGAEARQNMIVEIGKVREEMTVRAGSAPLPPPPPPASPGPPERAAPVAPPDVAAPPPPPPADSNVTPVRLVKQVKPRYPESAKSEKASGQVVLRGVISVDGSVIGLTTISANRADLEEAAKAAVQQWKFEPAKLNGQPVEVVTDLTINFQPE